jgi:hypothetical protein
MNRTFCKHLRTKSVYIEARLEAAFAEKEPEQSGPCHFWCNLTQTTIGPDDRPVQKNACTLGRACCQE